MPYINEIEINAILLKRLIISESEIALITNKYFLLDFNLQFHSRGLKNTNAKNIVEITNKNCLISQKYIIHVEFCSFSYNIQHDSFVFKKHFPFAIFILKTIII